MSNTIDDNKQTVMKRELQRIERELSGGTWTTRQKLALACRILRSNGHESGLAGQVTARDEQGSFLTQRLGCGLGEVCASNVLRVDSDLEVLEGTGMPNPANRFHTWIYRVRSDVQCIVHTHPVYTSALSMLEIPLEISHMDGCALYENVAFVAHWPGVPVGNEEGVLIATALGDKAAVLLAHHGAVIAATSIEEATVLAIQLERAAQLYLLAKSAGPVRAIDPRLGREARDWLLNPRRSAATFAYYARLELAADPRCTD